MKRASSGSTSFEPAQTKVQGEDLIGWVGQVTDQLEIAEAQLAEMKQRLLILIAAVSSFERSVEVLRVRKRISTQIKEAGLKTAGLGRHG